MDGCHTELSTHTWLGYTDPLPFPDPALPLWLHIVSAPHQRRPPPDL